MTDTFLNRRMPVANSPFSRVTFSFSISPVRNSVYGMYIHRSFRLPFAPEAGPYPPKSQRLPLASTHGLGEKVAPACFQDQECPGCHRLRGGERRCAARRIQRRTAHQEKCGSDQDAGVGDLITEPRDEFSLGLLRGERRTKTL